MLPCVNYAYLVFRGHAGIDRYLLNLALQLLIAHGIKFHAGQGYVALTEYAYLPRYGCRRYLVVAGYHHRAYACALGICYRLHGFRTWRVNHGYKSEEGEIVLGLGAQYLVRFLICKCQYAEPIFRKMTVLLGYRSPVRVGYRTHLVVQAYMSAAVQEHVYRAFCEYGRLTVQHVFRAHELSVRVKGHFLETLGIIAYYVLIYAYHRQHAVRYGTYPAEHLKECILRRIAYALAVYDA